jgi:hypothetical protein
MPTLIPATTAEEIAAFLRQTADRIDAASPGLDGFAGLRLLLDVSANSYVSDAPERERVAAIHTLAHHLGLTADREKRHSSWDYRGRQDHGGLVISASADLAAPPQRCACGQACTHSPTAAA